MEYPINRFAMEAKRHPPLDVLNRHLEGREWIVGDDITIADIAICPWYGRLVKGEAYDAGRVPVGSRVRERHRLGRPVLCAARSAARHPW